MGPHAAKTAAVLSARLMRLSGLWRNSDENASYLCVRAIIGRKHPLKMHEVAVETFQMRAAVDENDLSGNVLRLGEIDDRICDGGWRG